MEVMEIVIGDVSIDVVKLEFGEDSRNLHCQTRTVTPHLMQQGTGR